MQAELQLLVMAKLLNTDVGTLLNSCQRDEVESGWPWSFLLSNTVITSLVGKSVYSVPGFIEIYNIRPPIGGPGGDLVKISRELLNILDPTRLQLGGDPCEQWCDAGWDTDGNLQIELHTVPASIMPYIAEGKVRTAVMVNDTDRPLIPSAVIVNKAMWKCAMSLFAGNGEQRYSAMADTYYTIYKDELDRAQTADSRRQQQIKSTTEPVHRGLDYIATHDTGR